MVLKDLTLLETIKLDGLFKLVKSCLKNETRLCLVVLREGPGRACCDQTWLGSAENTSFKGSGESHGLSGSPSRAGVLPMHTDQTFPVAYSWPRF